MSGFRYLLALQNGEPDHLEPYREGLFRDASGGVWQKTARRDGGASCWISAAQ
jgi:hypothetical protein